MITLHPPLPDTHTLPLHNSLWESHFPAFLSSLLTPSSLSRGLILPLQVLCHLLVLGPSIVTSSEQPWVCSRELAARFGKRLVSVMPTPRGGSWGGSSAWSQCFLFSSRRKPKEMSITLTKTLPEKSQCSHLWTKPS